jgi:hypothetical protein
LEAHIVLYCALGLLWIELHCSNASANAWTEKRAGVVPGLSV